MQLVLTVALPALFEKVNLEPHYTEEAHFPVVLRRYQDNELPDTGAHETMSTFKVRTARVGSEVHSHVEMSGNVQKASMTDV